MKKHWSRSECDRMRLQDFIGVSRLKFRWCLQAYVSLVSASQYVSLVSASLCFVGVCSFRFVCVSKITFLWCLRLTFHLYLKLTFRRCLWAYVSSMSQAYVSFISKAYVSLVPASLRFIGVSKLTFYWCPHANVLIKMSTDCIIIWTQKFMFFDNSVNF